MGKNNNLTDFLTDIADCIREKTGYDELINPQDFKDYISNINSDDSDKTVVFYDYNGSILYRYTPEQFLTLGEMPEHPASIAIAPETKAVGWGWTYQEACDFVSTYEVLELEAKYTVDGKGNRYYINVTEENVGKSLILTYRSTAGMKYTLDWGNGTTYTFNQNNGSGTITYRTISTIYNSPGIYVIRTTGHVTNYLNDRIESIGWGKSINDCFLTVKSENITVSPIGMYNISSTSDTFGMLNPTLSTFCGQLFYYKASSDVGNLAVQWKVNRCAMPSIYIGEFATADQTSPFACNKLYCSGYNTMRYVYAKEIIFTTDGMTIGTGSSYDEFGWNSEKIVFPKGVNFDTSARLNYFYGILDFTKCTSIPSIGSIFLPNRSSAITANIKILVPKSLENEWKNATNWAVYANQIIGV